MADIDHVSQQLGSLTAIAVETNRKVDALFVKHDKLNEEVIEQRGAIKILGAAMTDHKAVDQVAHTKYDKNVSEVEALKNRGKGFVVGMSIAGGGGGAAIVVAALKMLGIA